MRKVGIGILGPGRIVKRVMADFHMGSNYELIAVASRDIDRARAAAMAYGAKYAFGSYEALAACPEVELVYVATPHPFHCENTLMMLSAGKHVLCEKPFALNDWEAGRMIACARARGLFLMEAMWSRFLPAMRDLKRRVDAGEIERIRHITANFAYAMPFDAQSRVFDPALGGGALLDVGVYPLSFASMLLGAKPDDVFSSCVRAESGVDARFAAQLCYPSGSTVQLMCGVDTETESRAMIYGEDGYIELPDFWHATGYRVVKGRCAAEYRFAPESEGHYHQFVHAADCILRGRAESALMPLDETLDIMRLLTRMRRERGILYPGEN